MKLSSSWNKTEYESGGCAWRVQSTSMARLPLRSIRRSSLHRRFPIRNYGGGVQSEAPMKLFPFLPSMQIALAAGLPMRAYEFRSVRSPATVATSPRKNERRNFAPGAKRVHARLTTANVGRRMLVST